MSKTESPVAELYVVSFTCEFKRYDKDLTYEDIEQCLKTDTLNKTYDEYIGPTLLYFAEDLDELAKALCVEKIVPQGIFIRGMYGGEEKKGAQKYAGIALEDFKREEGIFKFKLYGTRKTLEIPESELEKFGVDVYEAIYMSEINPFKIIGTIPILLSSKGGSKLREFLEYVVKVNERELSSDDVAKIRVLAKELKQPDKIEALNQRKYYVVYRRDRLFTASVFSPQSRPQPTKYVIQDTCSYMEVGNEKVAYYYVALLNYLAYKVVESNRAVQRHQLARPILALYIAGLSWCDVDEATWLKIVELSKRLHEKAPLKKYGNQNVALKEIGNYPEFRELKELLDKIVDKEKLERALNIVSG